MPEDLLIVFVKAPRPGLVKTRLAKRLGALGACIAYRELVGVLLHNLASLPSVQLRFTPDNAQAEIQDWLRPGWNAHPQGEGDLGFRLRSAFAETFNAGARRVAIIGSDCPEVSVSDIQQTWAALRKTDVVLGPATDGGYWLVALNRPQPQLFEDIAWSSHKVLEQTIKHIQCCGLKHHLLRTLTDVDSVESWRSFLLSRSP